MSKRYWALAAIGLVLLGSVLVLVIPPWRDAAFALFQRGSWHPPVDETLPRVDQGNTFWGESIPDRKSMPGIEFAAAHWWIWNEELVFAVWIDRPRPEGNLGFDHLTDRTNPGPGVWRYYIDRAGINLECRTTDGKGGSLTVNNERFDLSQGRLILVSTVGDRVRVKQLARDKLNLKAGPTQDPPESIVRLRADAEVRAFFDVGNAREK